LLLAQVPELGQLNRREVAALGSATIKSGERRQLAGENLFGRLPKSAGWQPALPRVFFYMQDLFATEEKETSEQTDAAAPLATRMRPRSLEEFVGQEHILAPGKLLRRAIEADRLPSVILSGPPGTGKTTLAQIIAEMTEAKFVRLSGVESNVAEMRRVVAAAANRRQNSGKKTIVFVDEIHHFNKTQQDILLPDVENGNLRLIGATTYNPFFYVNSALVSRSQVFRLESLRPNDLITLMKRALDDKNRGLGHYNVKITDEALKFLAEVSDGDARKALNALEIGVLTTPAGGTGSVPSSSPMKKSSDATERVPLNNGVIHFDLAVAQESIQQKAVVYDRVGDAHYDTISAFIKSMRASDEKGAIYWLAKMLHAGEDFRFIARRIVIFASEDVGLADAEALPLAIATQQAVEFVGMPEARIPLAHATAYMCRAPKNREAYEALNAATEEIESEQTKRVPENLKNKHFPVNPEA
jgi:putative ATPase